MPAEVAEAPAAEKATPVPGVPNPVPIAEIMGNAGFKEVPGGEPTPVAATPAAPAEPVKPPADVPAKPAEPVKPAADEFQPPTDLFGPKKPAEELPAVEALFPETPPEGLTDKAKLDYANFRKNYGRAINENKALKERVETISKTGDPNAKAYITELEGRLAELSNVVERENLVAHPAFQKQFVLPRKQAMEAASGLLTEVGLSGNALERAMSLSGKERIEALDDLYESITSPTVKSKITSAVNTVEQIDQQYAAAMSDVKGSTQQLELESRAARHKQFQEQERQLNLMVDAAVDGLRDKVGLEFLKKREGAGNEEWNAGVDARVATARELLTKTENPQQLAAAVVLATQTIAFRDWALFEAKRYQAVCKELAEYKSTDPGLGSGTVTTTTESAPPPMSGTMAIDAAMQALRNPKQ